MSKLIKLHTLNMYVVLYVNYISTKLSHIQNNSGGSYSKWSPEGKGQGVGESWPNGTSRKEGKREGGSLRSQRPHQTSCVLGEGDVQLCLLYNTAEDKKPGL